MDLDVSKNLGGIGAILLVIGCLAFAVPYGGILTLIGLILMLIGLKGLANFYNEGGIFNNALYSIILAIVGVVVAVATVAITALAALSSIGIELTNINDWTTFGSELTTRFTNFSDFNVIMNLIGAAVAALVILFVFAIVAAFFFRRSLNQLSSKTGVGLFGTAGILMLIGAVLTIVVIGLLLIWIAFILLAVGFFSIKTTTTQPPPATSSTPQS
jgi:uncharacterized membrane protein